MSSSLSCQTFKSPLLLITALSRLVVIFECIVQHIILLECVVKKFGTMFIFEGQSRAQLAVQRATRPDHFHELTELNRVWRVGRVMRRMAGVNDAKWFVLVVEGLGHFSKHCFGDPLRVHLVELID